MGEIYDSMITKRIISALCGVALLGLTLSSALPAAAEQAPDKNGPGVTRVSIVQGSVVVQRGDSNKQVAAVVNAPLLPGDYISTAANSRAELQFNGAAAVRLGGNVQARITNDDPNNRQVQLADGTIEVGLVRNAGVVQVDTPSVTVRSGQAGDYRITIARDGSSWVTTRRGSAEVVTPQRTYTLESGRTLVAHGSASDPSITYTSAIGYDSFDDFNAKRDQVMIASIGASPNLNPDIAGYDNLGAYGQWQNVPGYGQSWIPNQSSGWSPYGNGNWTWANGYGWTWVGAEPWGWAPYHYGNWYYANGYGWAWNPPAYSYPAWSPALVGFFGFGVGAPGWGVSVGFGGGGWGYPNIGWYPLWPSAPFYPWWPGWAWTGFGWGGGWGWGGGFGCCGFGFGSNVVNVTRVTNITNIYNHFPHGGIHGTTIGNFQHGSISGHTFSVDPRNVGSHVGMIHGAVPITPTHDNLGFGGHNVTAPVTLSKAFDSPRFASANRSLAGRMPFDQQQKAVSRALQGSTHNNAPVSRENGSLDRNGSLDHNGSLDRNGGELSRGTPDSWQRFNQARGMEGRGNAVASHGERTGSNGMSGRAPSDSWNRFSNQRGNASASSYGRGSYSRGESYGRDSDGRGSYGSESYGRNSYGSRGDEGYPSYARPSNSRGSYGSYPSYSRGSYGSYPSYSHGGGGYPAPHGYSGGGYGAPHPSGGGGGAPHGGGGGRPPR